MTPRKFLKHHAISSAAVVLCALASPAQADVTNLQTFSSRQSGFTAIMAEHRMLGAEPQTEFLVDGRGLILGPVVEDETRYTTLGPGAFVMTPEMETFRPMPTLDWSVDRTGDGFVTEDDVKISMETYIDQHAPTVLNQVRDKYRSLGIQNGWYSFSEEVETMVLRMVRETSPYTRYGRWGGMGFDTYLRAEDTGERRRHTVTWSAFVMSNSTDANFYGDAKMISNRNAVIIFEVNPLNVNPVLDNVAAKMEPYKWGNAQQAIIPGTVDLPAAPGTLRWKIVENGDVTNPAASSGQTWNVVNIGSSLDRPEITQTATGSNALNPSDSFDPVNCVVSKSNPGCAGFTFETYEEIREITGVENALIIYHEQIAPTRKLVRPDDPDDGEEIYDIRYQVLNRSVQNTGFCAPANYTINYCQDFTLEYTRSLYGVDSITFTAEGIEQAVQTKPIEVDASCAAGVQAPAIAGSLTPEQSSFAWHLNGGTASSGPVDDYIWDLRMADPRPAPNEFPMEHIDRGDETVLNADFSLTTGYGFRGTDSLGVYSWITSVPAASYNLQSPACAACYNLYPATLQGMQNYCASTGDTCDSDTQTSCLGGTLPFAP